jgi:hypothetical protein
MESVHNLCQVHFPNAECSYRSMPRMMNKAGEQSLCTKNGQGKSGYSYKCNKACTASIENGSQLSNYHLYTR